VYPTFSDFFFTPPLLLSSFPSPPLPHLFLMPCLFIAAPRRKLCSPLVLRGRFSLSFFSLRWQLGASSCRVGQADPFYPPFLSGRPLPPPLSVFRVNPETLLPSEVLQRSVPMNSLWLCLFFRPLFPLCRRVAESVFSCNYPLFRSLSYFPFFSLLELFL